MYFAPDGRSAIVVAEALLRLDFRDPHTMALQYSIAVPKCAGVNHADFAIDGRFVIFTCEFNGSLVKERRLGPGDRIQIGSSKLEFVTEQVPPAPQKAPPASVPEPTQVVSDQLNAD